MASASETARARRLKTLFDLTPEEYETILEYQGGHCAMCPRVPTTTRLAVDHNHKTGEVRGLLCWLCNVALGKFKDDNEWLERANAYAHDPPAPKALGRKIVGRVGRTTNKSKRKKRKKKSS